MRARARGLGLAGIVLCAVVGRGCVYQPLAVRPPGDSGCLPQGQDGCDGVDNDCDEELDEDCCSGFETRGCGSDVGACVAGTQTCAGGLWGPCVGEVAPVAENCQADTDEDCDGFAGCLDLDCMMDLGCDASCGGTMSQLSCGGTLPVDTRGGENSLSWYDCSAWDETGREQVYAFALPSTQEVTLRQQAGDGADLDLLVLEGTCRQRSCIAHGDVEVTFVALAGRTYYLVADGFAGAEGVAEYAVSCLPLEEWCANGLDDDLDGLLDCDDPECSQHPGCSGSACATLGTISCGGSRFWSSDTAGGSSDNLDGYSCAGGGVGPFTAPEVAWSFTAPFTGNVEIFLDHTSAFDELRLFVLEEACTGDRCLGADTDHIGLTVENGQQYFLVIDSNAPIGGSFSIALQCPEVCDNFVDDDADGLADCFDPECASACTGEEVCGNGLDDGGDWGADCVDPACANDWTCLDVDCQGSYGEVLGCGGVYDGNTTSGLGVRSLTEFYSGCTAPAPLDGPEEWLRFLPMGNGPVAITVSPSDFWVGVGTGCPDLDCQQLDPGGASFTAVAGTDYRLIVDAPAGVLGPYTLSIDCDFEDCANTHDDDGDGAVDCADGDCAGTVLCEAETCTADLTLRCGEDEDVGFPIPHPPVASRSSTITRYGAIGVEGPCGNGPQPGPETVVRVTSGTHRIANLSVSTGSGATGPLWSYFLAGACEAELCTMAGGAVVGGVIGPDQDGFVVIDGPPAGDPVTLTLSCSDPWEECANGRDDDGDGLTDCADPSCDARPECVLPPFGCPGQAWAHAGGTTLGCGESVCGFTADHDASAVLDNYGCNPTAGMGGPEKSYRFSSPADAQVHAWLRNLAGDDLKLAVLTGSCAAEDCVDFHSGEVHFAAVADRVYHLVVDGHDGMVGAFELTVACD